MDFRTILPAVLLISALTLLMPLEQAEAQAQPESSLEGRLTRVVIPNVDFHDATFEEALQFLTLQTKEAGKEPRGVNFSIQDPEGTLKAKPVKWLRLKNVPAREVLGYLLSICGATARFDPYAVLIRAHTDVAVDNRTASQKEVMAAAAKIREANLAHMIIPNIAFDEVLLREGLDFITQQSATLDKNAPPLNFVVLDQELLMPRAARSIRLRNVPVPVALNYFLRQCNAEARYEANAIIVTLRNESTKDTRTETQKAVDAAAAKNREASLARINMPIINFEETTLAEGVDFLRQRIVGIEEYPPVNFIIEDPAGALTDKKVKSLKLKNVPLTDALAYILIECGAQVRYDEYAVVITPKS